MTRGESPGPLSRGLRRTRLRRRWRDETAFLMRNPANARRLLDSIAELDRWATILDRPAVHAHDDAA